MGHIRLGVLPKTHKWQEVVAKLEVGDAASAIARASFEAAETDLESASTDPTFLESFWLLTQLPLAARGSTFASDARSLGLPLPDNPSLTQIASAFSAAVDQEAKRSGGRTDLGEMAQMAAAESLIAVIGPRLPSLFGPSPADVQREIGRLSSGQEFAVLAREFFTRLTQRVLHYYLSRELSNHVGGGRRFASDAARGDFDAALDLHCQEASRILKEFVGGWYGKRVYQQREGMTPEAVRGFASVAFRKIRSELRKRQDADG
jgi:hypothetical protein